MVVAMSVGLRMEAAAAVDARLWERTMDIIKNHSGHAARWACARRVWRQACNHNLHWCLINCRPLCSVARAAVDKGVPALVKHPV
jgi:hypothetical protein